MKVLCTKKIIFSCYIFFNQCATKESKFLEGKWFGLVLGSPFYFRSAPGVSFCCIALKLMFLPKPLLETSNDFLA